MLDSWHPEYRHLLFMLAPVVLAWVGRDFVPVLAEHNSLAAGLVGVIVTTLAAWLTPLTRQYGVGAPAVPVDPTR